VTSQAEKFAEQAASTNAVAEVVLVTRGWRYYVSRAALYMFCGYIVMCAVIYFMQHKIIYRPAISMDLQAKQWGFAATHARDISIQAADGTALNGWLVSPGGPKSSGLKGAPLVDLFFGSETGHRGERVNTLKRLAGRGAWVVNFDYRGFGDNVGAPSEDALAKDARAAWNALLERGVKPACIVLHGEGLGAAIALRLASELCAENALPGGVVLEGAFSRLPDFMARRMPFIPMRYMTSDKYDSREHVKSVTCPLLMISGARDSYAPVGDARALFDAAPSASKSGVAKTFVELPNATNAELGAVDTDAYIASIDALFHTVNPSQSSSKTERKPVPEGTQPPAGKRKKSRVAPAEAKEPPGAPSEAPKPATGK
jgi:uncharacterized protein